MLGSILHIFGGGLLFLGRRWLTFGQGIQKEKCPLVSGVRGRRTEFGVKKIEFLCFSPTYGPKSAVPRRDRFLGFVFRAAKSACSERLDGPDRYTRDFKYPHNQKSAGIQSGDRGGHGYLQCLLTILSSPNVCIRNALTGLAV
ncbi:hypothetical protein TNCV_5108331 [Trichonephila clavipes]|nr:hypothetical protein TNCV_5108331 [Trichonephila clavipes]